MCNRKRKEITKFPTIYRVNSAKETCVRNRTTIIEFLATTKHGGISINFLLACPTRSNPFYPLSVGNIILPGGRKSAALSSLPVGNEVSNEAHFSRSVSAIMAHFFFLAAFFWLNTMCFNIWWTFR